VLASGSPAVASGPLLAKFSPVAQTSSHATGSGVWTVSSRAAVA